MWQVAHKSRPDSIFFDSFSTGHPMATTKDFNFTAELTVLDTDRARANYQKFCDHAVAEWSGDLEATMATVSPDNPFQIFQATQVEVWGYDEVRKFYADRLVTFQGQGFHAKRWIFTDDVAVGRGWFKGNPKGMFFGTMSFGKPLFFPMTLWIYFDKDSLIQGETAYSDSAELHRQIQEGHTGDVTLPVY
jgi:predicted ester cyclase